MRSRSALASAMQAWPMLAAIGSGLVLTATSAGVIDAAAAEEDGAGLAVVGITLSACGCTALGWAVIALRAGRVPAPRATLASALIVVAASAAVLSTGLAAPLGVAVLPVLVAVVFAFVVAAGAGVELRRLRRAPLRRRSSVVGLIIGAALVAALATPALAATEAGERAVPHGELHTTDHHAGH